MSETSRREEGSPGRQNDVLYFIDISPAKVGGVELFARQLALALADCGRGITFCFSAPPTNAVAALFELPNVRLTHMRCQDSFALSKVGELWRLIRSVRPSTVVYSFGSIVRPLPWVCRLAGARRILYNDHASRVPGDDAASLAKRFAARMLTFPVDSVIAVSDFVAGCSRREGLHGAPAMTILNGIDLARRSHSASKQEFFARYAIPQGRRVVSQLSWLVKEKGVDIFLMAAAEVLRQDREIHFVVGGDGASRTEYESLAGKLNIAGNVTFTGPLADPVVSGLYTASDVFCLASRWREACGLVLLEAMSFGVPVVATRAGGIPEFVRDGADGFLVAADATEFATAILSLLHDEAKRATMGAAARKQMEQAFDVRQMAACYAALLAGPEKRRLCGH